MSDANWFFPFTWTAGRLFVGLRADDCNGTQARQAEYADTTEVISTILKRQTQDEAIMTTSYQRAEVLAQQNRQKVVAFARLRAGWNGPGSVPVAGRAIERTLSALESLPIQPVDIFPTGRGSVQIEYDMDESALEIEIREDVVEFLECSGSDYREWSSDNDADITAAVSRFYGIGHR